MTRSNLTAWERWELGSFDEERPAPTAEQLPPTAQEQEPEISLPTAEEIEQIYQQARDEGFAKGQAEGREAGHQAGQKAGYDAGYQEGQAKALAEAQRFVKAAAKLEAGLERLDAEVAEELLALAIELAREVVRQEISARPESLLALVRDALGQLPHQHTSIYLNPEDASLLRSYQGDQLAHAGHRIHEDAKLARGDCMIEAGGSQLDATVAMRWQRVIEGLGIASAWQTDAVPPAPTVGQEASATDSGP
jgi:flagellar assembly protein FliH